jgi:hypothetical protein
MEGVERLAVAIIKQAVADACKDTDRIKNTIKKKIAEKEKYEATKFLTTRNDDLKYWCNIANLDFEVCYAAVSKVKTEKSFWKKILKEIEA